MSIQKIARKSGTRYRARVYVAGKQVTKTFDRKSDAEQWEREQLVQRTKPQDPNQVHMSVAELVEQWMEQSVSSKAPGTQVRYRQVMELYVLPHFGDRCTCELTTQEIADWFSRLHASDLSPNTANQILDRLKSLLNWGLRRRWLTWNPAGPIERVELPHNTNEGDWSVWSAHECGRFLGWASAEDPLLHDLTLTALNTGMRLGELVGLQWDCVDLSRRLVTVRRIWDNKLGGLKETTKGRRRRDVGINSTLLAMLQERQLSATTEWVFEESGGPVRSNKLTEERFRPSCRRAGVPEIRFHDTRHTYAVLFMMSPRADIYKLKRILGHSSITTTEKYLRYAERFAAELVEAAEVVSITATPTGQVIPWAANK